MQQNSAGTTRQQRYTVDTAAAAAVGKLVAEHTRVVVVVVSRQDKQSSQVAREAQSRILDKPAAAVDKPSIADSSHAAAVDRDSAHTVPVVAVHTLVAVVAAVHTHHTRSADTNWQRQTRAQKGEGEGRKRRRASPKGVDITPTLKSKKRKWESSREERRGDLS